MISSSSLQKTKREGKRLLVLFLFVLISFLMHIPLDAQNVSISDLREKIDERNVEIKKIEEQIKKYQVELKKVGGEKTTLQNAIKELEINAGRLRSEINLTENKISRANLTIEELSHEITEKESKMKLNREAIGEIVRQLNQEDHESLVEIILKEEKLSEVWSRLDTLNNLQLNIRNDLRELEELKKELEGKYSAQVSQKKELEELTAELVDKKSAIDYNKQEKDKLLDQTKSKEASYQTLLQEQIARREQFEAELRALESQLQIAIDPSRLPSTGAGVLGLPLANPRITQYFGNTKFASANAQVYNGNGHNGMDFGTPIGTEIYAAEGGTVKGTGNTDLSCPGASYGKWVLVEHTNGLSTLYAHLSVISVAQGQGVTRGQVVGYSGNTGFSTGPHLHFTVYATQGVQVKSFPSKGCPGAIYTMPVADLKAYLNPLSYLSL